ncbi:UDP-4-amino-4,6-dideoxy-N-acetyl-beta-L-altrosamine N-acetyltransferase [Paraglaciecola aquimarina]|uniref:UDP-4-amino-4, 6-dideoxy-N-acetyl-beta-L-altrosamine N-acetyltransferase n=1 Tax=Paraglaciecola aquimarina TaxID=1235557 RepID=A0ABU3T0F4_9ALTE|nr:UDP-4-amino-4,6-dideoxy-N-acetyl-beta-L-altrosamine N-acetyltransferase [Paraglaciecola aquimarina]MDU0355718.1 UDP-4-amino-4,6-dideoxy-N-acetyl-beta-L-altrosamine N-acetyltransferase [Paraglaciecola aquimarina]
MKVGLPSHEFKALSQSQLKLVWQWRNSPRIQQNMHNDQPVEWQDHCRWFEKLACDTSRQFFILWQNKQPIGVLNFSDLHTSTPEWGCYLGETNVWLGNGHYFRVGGVGFCRYSSALY